MTTYAYMRVSTLEQVDGTSLSNQKRECKGLAMTGGLYIETYIEDKGVSGATNFFERMTAHNVTLKSGDVVIVAKLDRFSRDAADALNTIKVLKGQGVRLIINGHGDVTDDTNIMARLILEVMAVFAGHERRVIKSRQKDGQAAKKARGGHIGGSAPFGYRVEGKGHKAELVKDDVQQAALLDVIAWHGEKMSLRGISAQVKVKHGVVVSHESVRRAIADNA
jgi:DNA invertase Pin-like site-specific DNA recombinase